MRSTPLTERLFGVVACEEPSNGNNKSEENLLVIECNPQQFQVNKNNYPSLSAAAVSEKQGGDAYYYLPPDAVAPSLPLVPRRTSRSYENVKLKEKGKETRDVTSPDLNPPIPRRRAQSSQPTMDYCPVTPPMPRRRKEKTNERSKLFKMKSIPPSCPVPQDSPQLPPKGKNNGFVPSLPPKENNDSSERGNPSPYYSLPPDSSPVEQLDIPFDDSEEEESSKLTEEDFELYLDLDKEIQAKSREDKAPEPQKLPSCPPLPPKVS